MSYGDNGDCIGWLLGAENQGMRCMFTMMNNARLSVGCQGLAIAERAFQQALDYASQRKQGRHPGMKAADHVAIIKHPDVRRTLMLMRSLTEARSEEHTSELQSLMRITNTVFCLNTETPIHT